MWADEAYVFTASQLTGLQLCTFVSGLVLGVGLATLYWRLPQVLEFIAKAASGG